MVTNFLVTLSPGFPPLELGGGIAVTLFVLYQLYAPKWLNVDTALAPIVRDVPKQVEDLRDSQMEVQERVDELQDDVEDVNRQNKTMMQVQRAQARANDQMDERRVDTYLVENGVEPDEFLHGDEMSGYENWTKEDTEGEGNNAN